MNIKLLKNILFLAFLTVFLLSCRNNEIYIVTFNDVQKNYLENYLLFKKYDVKIIETDYYIKLNKINEEILIEILNLLKINIEIIQDNISNVNTTRTFDGGPFKRKYLNITIENGIEINVDEKEGWLSYDPTHPDAIRTGEKAGYLEYPNVYLDREYFDLTEVTGIYNSIVAYINNNYKKIVIEKIDINLYYELLRNIKIDRQNDLIIKYLLENKWSVK